MHRARKLYAYYLGDVKGSSYHHFKIFMLITKYTQCFFLNLIKMKAVFPSYLFHVWHYCFLFGPSQGLSFEITPITGNLLAVGISRMPRGRLLYESQEGSLWDQKKSKQKMCQHKFSFGVKLIRSRIWCLGVL